MQKMKNLISPTAEMCLVNETVQLVSLLRWAFIVVWWFKHKHYAFVPARWRNFCLISVAQLGNFFRVLVVMLKYHPWKLLHETLQVQALNLNVSWMKIHIQLQYFANATLEYLFPVDAWIFPVDAWTFPVDAWTFPVDTIFPLRIKDMFTTQI